MARRKLWAGLDVGVQTTSICIVDDVGEILRECSCRTTARDVRHELATFRRNRFVSAALEASSATHLAWGLRSLGYPVEIYETRQLSKFLRARRNKTDAGDARGIAEAGRISANAVSRVYLKDLETQCLLSRLTIRRLLSRQRVAILNLIQRQVEQFGGRLPKTRVKGKLKQLLQTEIRKIFAVEPLTLTAELRFLLEHYERMERHLREVDLELTNAAKSNEVCCRLMEIPGVGPICALNFYAAVGDPHRFPCAADIGCYFGLTPRIHQSGLRCRTGRISRMGNTVVRSLLVQSAVCFMRCGKSDSDLRTWTLEVERRRGKSRARVALARKLAVLMLTVWRNGMRYEPLHSAPLSKLSAREQSVVVI